MSSDLSHAVWRKSTSSTTNSSCVEVADLGDHYALRDSKHPDGPVLMFTALEWECFLDGVDKGEFPRR